MSLHQPSTDPQPPTEHPEPCQRCGGQLHEHQAAWNTKTDVRCQRCGAGGHITPDGTQHGPAFQPHKYSSFQP